MDKVERHLETLVALALAAIIVVLMSGCAGVGFKSELYRIDEREESQKTHHVPLKCLFTDCRGGVEK